MTILKSRGDGTFDMEPSPGKVLRRCIFNAITTTELPHGPSIIFSKRKLLTEAIVEAISKEFTMTRKP